MRKSNLVSQAMTAFALTAATVLLLSPRAYAEVCVPVGAWAVPSARGPVHATAREVLHHAAQRSVILLGELHDRAEHHRWQLQTLAALHVLRPEMALGFEMFPRRVQPVLDRWVAGELSEAEFLRQSDWEQVWGFESAHYLPLFHFARLNRVPLLALNVERALVREVARNGWDSVPDAMREGVSRPAPASSAYLRELHAIYLDHPESAKTGQDDPAFQRFVQGQLTWDRAMAQAIRAALAENPRRQVVAVLGRGHARAGAVPHQLRELGVSDVAVLLPWENDASCDGISSDSALAVFGVEPPRASVRSSSRPRLGVTLDAADGARVRIERVASGSIAQAIGLRSGDILFALAGTPVKTAADVQRIVRRQAPGTWLPIVVRRDANELELIAKFPPDSGVRD